MILLYNNSFLRFVIFIHLIFIKPALSCCQDSKFTYGFHQAFLYSNDVIKTNNNHNFSNIAIKNLSGIGIGVSVYYLTSEKFKLRLSSELGFEETRIEFQQGHRKITIPIETSSLRLPLHAMFTLSKSFQLMVIGGYSPNFAFAKTATDEGEIKLKSFDSTIDFGLSYPIKFKKFVISPELKYCYGFINVAKEGNDPFANSINAYFRHRVQLVGYFSFN